jgi:hypothetical protein
LAGSSSFEVRGNQLKRCYSFRQTFDDSGKSYVKQQRFKDAWDAFRAHL